jgi:EAL domain-containing protein (putative c-di-GMP-specific phosphodiesterase class I)
MEAGADHLQGFYFAAPSASIPDESLNASILAKLLRMRGPRRLTAVGHD